MENPARFVSPFADPPRPMGPQKSGLPRSLLLRQNSRILGICEAKNCNSESRNWILKALTAPQALRQGRGMACSLKKAPVQSDWSE